MKRMLFLMVLALTFVLCGCKGEDVRLALDEPPSLMVANGQSEAKAGMFGYTWERKTADGKAFVKIADSISPIDVADDLPVISIRPMYVSTINPMNAYLMFEVVPDKVTARCFDTRLNGENSVDIEILDAHIEDGTYCPDIILKLKNENCIYEITAEWNSYDEFGGSATYCFRTDGAITNNVNAIVIN